MQTISGLEKRTMYRTQALAIISTVCTGHSCLYRMKLLLGIIFVLMLLLLILMMLISMDNPVIEPVLSRKPRKDREFRSDSVHIGVVICGNRLEEGTMMLKSAYIFSKTELIFHIFTEDNLRKDIDNEINSWHSNQSHRLKVNMYKIQYPFPKSCPTCSRSDWMKLFRPCATQRLFIPDILTDVDSLIYMDTDTLFLSPVENVWDTFSKLSPKQLAGIGAELSGWYTNKQLPKCKPAGVNSGVMLMNLTRLRASRWMVELAKYYTDYREHLRLGDQDLINFYCQFQAGSFYTIPCSFNYRGIFCSRQELCSSTMVHILHGNSMAFHENIFPAIKSVYRSIKEYDPISNSPRDLFDSMMNNLKQHSGTACGKLPHIFTRYLENEYVTTNNKQ